MGSKNKLKHFQENETFSNVIQPSRETLLADSFEYKGKWNTHFFKNENPIVLELGCGKGEYTIHLAKKNPNFNFIGIDIKGARFWRGAKISTVEKITNVAFIRSQIELVNFLFKKNEVCEIWITFPDPQIKYKRTKHRLTNPAFLDLYKKVLTPKGKIHLKTDSEFLFGYTLGILRGLNYPILYAHHDIYNNVYSPEEATAVQTFYEKKYLVENKPITYIQFQLASNG